MWIRLSAPWDYRQPGFTIAYQAGDYNVTTDCARMATEAGVATRLRKAGKNEEPTEWLSDPEPAPSIAE